MLPSLHADDEIVARTRKQGCLRHLEITVQANEGMRNVIASMDCVELHGRAYREKTRVAVLFIDLDRFKMVHDQHGHEEEELLRHADEALYRVKNTGRNGLRSGSRRMRTRKRSQRSLECPGGA